MSVYTHHVRSGSNGSDRFQSNIDEYDSEPGAKIEKLPNIVPELSIIIRKLLPNEILLNMHVRNVEYLEYGCERLNGTLYMTIFRLVFAPDNEIENQNLIFSGNKYLGEYDIPLTSIYRMNVASNDSRTGRRVFRSEVQGQMENRTFTILTRDFRLITFSKSSMKKSNSSLSKSEVSSTKMETYIDALKYHTRCQDKQQLYPFITSQRTTIIDDDDDSIGIRSLSDNLTDYGPSNDERIKSYLICQDWYEELREASEYRWIVDDKKFNRRSIAQDESPFVRLQTINNDDTSKNWIWHWTHTSQGNQNSPQYMLVTVPGIREIGSPHDSHRRSNSSAHRRSISASHRRSSNKTTLPYTNHSKHQQSFQRYNLSKFPCSLKNLESSYEKLVEICVNTDEDDEEWSTKLDACQWLQYVSKALHGAASLAKILNYKNIQLTGSDVDNSCLMASLIQIFLRPNCRTIKGFCQLIVKEWIIRGHPFRERFGQVIFDADRLPAQESPVFLLFLDCVHQLLNQNPISFEFTEYFLIEIYRAVCYCYHHTFAFNSVFERLVAIDHCPKNILVLSTFDFSLYLQSDIQHLLKNHASIFVSQKISVPSRSPLPTGVSRTPSTKMSHMHELLNKTLSVSQPSYRLEAPKSNNFLTPPAPSRRMYRLELPKSDVPSPPPSPLSIRSLSSSSSVLNASQFEYDEIDVPQKFSSDLHVDWRLISLVLWSKCYCRYDQNSIPTLAEQELSLEISSLEKQIENRRKAVEESTTIDAFHSINYANSWYPQLFVTRV